MSSAAMHQPQPQKLYTYADYLTWPDEPRYEIIDGLPYLMSAPTVSHQDIVGEIFWQLKSFLRDKPCKVIIAPCDVRLNPLKSNKDRTVVQPDVLVVCDPKKLEDGKSVKGAPDLVIEVLSPSSARKDRLLKFKKYLQAGVKEFWIVSPEERIVYTHVLVENRYFVALYGREDAIPISVLEGCNIDLHDIFPPDPEEKKKNGPDEKTPEDYTLE